MESVNDSAPARINFLTGPVFRSRARSCARARATQHRDVARYASTVDEATRARARRCDASSRSRSATRVVERRAREPDLHVEARIGSALVVPRGWRATDQPSYPGLLLWMLRSQPEGKMVLTAEPFTRAALLLVADRVPPSVGPAAGASSRARCARSSGAAHPRRSRPGRPEGERAGRASRRCGSSYDDGKHFLRQAVALDEDRVVSLCSRPSRRGAQRNARAFEQALRTLRPLTPEELGSALTPPEQVVMQLVADAGVAMRRQRCRACSRDVRGRTATKIIRSARARTVVRYQRQPRIDPIGARPQQRAGRRLGVRSPRTTASLGDRVARASAARCRPGSCTQAVRAARIAGALRSSLERAARASRSASSSMRPDVDAAERAVGRREQ